MRLNMQYRRAKTKGGCYFFTVNLANRNQHLLTEHIDILRSNINRVKNNHPFKVDAMVILPEHLHAVITLPDDDSDYAKRWMLIKSGFSRQMPKKEIINQSKKNKRERGIWQRRYWEHQIRDDKDYENHVNYVHYVHYNPVKHGYVNQASEWSYSTIHQYIKNGILSQNWGKAYESEDRDYGERKY